MKFIYVCGPTVYAKVHIGNMKPIITFDLFIQASKALGQEYFFIHNITDIDDKIIDQAIKENTTETFIAEKYSNLYKNEMKEYNILEPNAMPTVTENLQGIIKFIQELIKIKAAYISNGSVYFNTSIFDNYGNLSNRKNVETIYTKTNKDKKYMNDFVLWKTTTKGVKYKSPWGQGRPGWHTECVVMIRKYAKEKQLEVHGGGIDLLFPHHENEEIQYYAIETKSLAKEWFHVGKIDYLGQKMSKSVGNIINAEEFRSSNKKDLLRLILLMSNVKTPLDINKALLENANKLLSKIIKTYFLIQLKTPHQTTPTNNKATEKIFNLEKKIYQHITSFEFPKATNSIIQFISFINKQKDWNIEDKNSIHSIFLKIIQNIGFSFVNYNFVKWNTIYNNWKHFVIRKDFDQADLLRIKLIEKGLI